jgi:hypothetical protein
VEEEDDVLDSWDMDMDEVKAAADKKA